VQSSSRTFSNFTVVLDRLAQLAFCATLVLIPMRLRLVLLPRPNLPVYGDYTDFLLFAPDMALLLTLALWGLFLLKDHHRIRLGPAYLWIPLAGMSLAGLLSAGMSVDRALSLYHLVRIAALFLFFLYIVNEIASPFWVIASVALQGFLQAVIAIAQFILQRSIGLQALGEYPLDPNWNGVSIVSTGSQRILRAYGLSDHPNILGGCLAFGLVLLLAAYLHGDWKIRLMILVPFLPMALALLLTYSRSAWLAFLAGAVLLVGIEAVARHWHSIKALTWLALAGGLVLVPFIAANLPSLGIRLDANRSFMNIPAEEQSIGERLLLIESANHIFADHALTGIGLGASPTAMKEAYPEFPVNYQPPHLTLLDAGLETGIFGAAFYFLLLILPWIVLWRHRDVLSQPEVAAAAALLLAVSVVGFFDYYTWLLVPGRLWQWLAWGLFAVAMDKANRYELA
jgi:O-antigen ligase